MVFLLSIIFVLAACSTHSISADDSTDNQETLMDKGDTRITTTEDSKYQLHIQVILRNAEGHLIGVTEGTYGLYVPHKLTDNSFDTLFGEKKIVTVDGIKYEKVQFGRDFNAMNYLGDSGVGGLWLVEVCGQLSNELLDTECANIFEVRTNQVVLEVGDIITTNWVILRTMN